MITLCAILLVTSASIEAEMGRVIRVGGVHVEDDSGAVLVSWQGDIPRVPASVLKLATAAACLHALGEDTRVTTDLVYDPQSKELCVIGGGDPFLVSESLRRAADSLVARGITEVRSLAADCGLFVHPLTVDGQGMSTNPYDAALCALSANFNTVALRIEAKGQVTCGEPETPLTPMARRMGARLKRPGTYRLSIVDGVVDAPTYALELLRELLRERGVVVGDSIRLGRCESGSPVTYRHHSQQTVAGIVAAMLEYSNNVIANTLLLTTAAALEHRPVTLADGACVLERFLADSLGLQGFVVREGSGLSRENRLTPRHVVCVLRHLRRHGYDELLPMYHGTRAKTGTLEGVSCLAGYLPLADGRIASFAMLLQGNVGLRDRVLGILRDRLGARGQEVKEGQGRRVDDTP